MTGLFYTFNIYTETFLSLTPTHTCIHTHAQHICLHMHTRIDDKQLFNNSTIYLNQEHFYLVCLKQEDLKTTY